MDNKTRLFFVVWANARNEEIFETREEADEYARTIIKPKISIAIVKNAYREEAGDWNYEDHEDTFDFIKNL